MPHALFIGRTLESFSDAVMVPWFSEAGVKAIRSPRPSVVVVPSHSVAARIREVLSGRGVAALGVRFWTPADLRAHLSRGHKGTLLEDACDRRLVLRAAAESISTKSGNGSAVAIAASPASLADTIDIVEAGGWGADVIGGDEVGAVLRARADLLKSSECLSPHAFAFSVQVPEPSIADLLVVGFGGGHWEEWGTLAAASKSSETTTVLLTTPRQKAEQMDLTWIASWESLGGTAQFIHDEPSGNAVLAARFDELPNLSGAPAASAPIDFVLAAQYEEEAKASVAAACKALTEGAKRVAIIVPRQGALSLEIARRIELLNIPHYNGTPPAFTDHVRATTVTRLLTFLAQPSAENFLDLANDQIVLKSSILPLAGVRSIVEKEASSFLFGDAVLLSDHLLESGYEKNIQAGKFVKNLCVWNPVATVEEYLSALSQMLENIGSPLRADVNRLSENAKPLRGFKITREGMAEWLLAKLIESEPSRTTLGSNRFARLQILLPRDAAGLSWDHIVLTGQNEGVWPPPAKACPYLGDDALRALNDQVFLLNRAALEGGADDEVHPVRPGHALCVSPGIERSLVLRDFANLLETARGMTITASQSDPTKPGLPAYPGEIFSRLFQLVTGKTVGRAGDAATSGAYGIAEEHYPSAPESGITEMMRARTARLSTTGMHEYEYAMKSSPDWEVSISCSQWDRVTESPAAIFLASYCGVRPSRNIAEEMPWKKVAGVWAHLWIEKVVGRAPIRVSDIGDWNDRIRAEAELFKAKMTLLLEKQGRSLPAWWSSLWQIAYAQAQQFATSLSVVRGYEYVQSEFVIPRTEVVLPNGAKLPLNGRIDLVFFDRLPDPTNGFRDVRLFLFDFKTGANRGLKVDYVRKLEGIQLPLYSLAVDALGANTSGQNGAKGVDLCILKPGEKPVAQLNLDDVKAQNDVWEELSRMHSTGKFGRTEAYREEFGFSAGYPIACLETRSEIMEAPAAIKHPAAA